jgi:hypothetical protein
MSTNLGMQWSQLIGNLLNSGAAQVGQNLQAATAADQRQQQIDLQKQQEQRQAQQQDMDFHQLMMDRGAQVVGPGDTVHSSVPMHPLIAQMLAPAQSGAPGESSNMFDDQGNPNPAATFTQPNMARDLLQAMAPAPAQGNLPILRKADPANIVKHTDATGDVVKYELPDPNTVDGQYSIAQAQARAAQRLQAQQAAESAGQEQGRLQAQNQNREQYGTPLDPDLAKKYDIDPNLKLLPTDKLDLATHYFSVMGAQTRAGATTDAAKIRADATNYKTDLDNTTKQAIADQRSIDAQRLQDLRDKWNAATIAARQNAQTNLNARAFVNGSARNLELYTKLLGSVSTETQRQMQAGSLLATGPDGNPVTADGDTFRNPWDGKQYTMNPAQRIRLQSGMRQSQSTVSGYQQTLADLDNQRDNMLNRFGGGPVGAPRSPAGGGGGPQATPGAPGGGLPNGGYPPGLAPSAPAPMPSNRPPTWADQGRAESGGGPHLTPGRGPSEVSGATRPGAGRPGGAPAAAAGPTTPYKVGDTRSYNGRTYKFDGRQWIGQ